MPIARYTPAEIWAIDRRWFDWQAVGVRRDREIACASMSISIAQVSAACVPPKRHTAIRAPCFVMGARGAAFTQPREGKRDFKP